MKNNDIWKKFEDVIASSGELSFWMRDDDVRATSHKFFDFKYFKYKYRLNAMLKMYHKFGIPALMAVIPYGFHNENGIDIVKMIKKYNVYVALHGTKHTSNSKVMCSEYPDGCDIDFHLKNVLEDKKLLQSLFKEQFLSIFIPPYNAISSEFSSELEKYFDSVSSMNYNNAECLPINVDIDFENWSNFTQKTDEAILNEIIDLINQGRTFIGFNSHHKYIKHKGLDFFKKFFKVVKKHSNVKWILPFNYDKKKGF